jgi:hypothetical protein
MRYPEYQTEQVPAGKRTIRRTVHGSIQGYVGGRFWCNFGDAYDTCAEADANDWVAA